MLTFLAVAVLQAAALPAEFTAQGQAMARDSVTAEFCASVGWDANPAAPAALAAEIDALATRTGVAPDEARAALTAMAREATQALRAETAPPAPDPASRRAFIDRLDAKARRDCTALAQRRPAMFRGDVATNQAQVDRVFAGIRNPSATPAGS